MNLQQKQICRLCYYETVDTTDIFSKNGIAFDYIGKINKYLYFSVSKNDGLPKTVCWMCTQHLETFHKFYEKINGIQKERLSLSKYQSVILPCQQPPSFEKQKQKKKHNTLIDSDENTFEIFVISDICEEKATTIDNEFEEFELLEVDQIDAEETIENPEQQFPKPTDQLPINGMVENESHSSTRISMHQKTKPTIGTVPIQRKSARQAAKLQKSPVVMCNSKKTETSIGKKRHKTLVSQKREESSATGNTIEVCDEMAEGESDNDFPSRNSDNEDWPSQNTLDEFPKEIVKDGLLAIKGRELMSMICRFYNLECKQCEMRQRFKELKDLFDHYESAHNEPGYVECCQIKFHRYPAIIMHMARHLQPDAFKCDECGYIVTRPRFLESHKRTHLPNDQKPFVCDKCPRRFCWKSALRIHKISHERRQYICQVCGRKYDTPGGLSTHKKLVHSGRKPSQSNVCHICAKIFSTRTGLHEHMITIHQPREKGQMQCNECGKWLMNSRCLKTHMILHSDSKFQCNQCDYVTKKRVLLNRHLLTKHSNERPFVCNLCGRDFKIKRSLTVHLAQHGSTTKYQCTFCDRKFNSSTNFYAHRKSLHPKELKEMRQREENEQRRKRIEAGVEKEQSFRVTEIRDSQLILTTETGEEYTVLEVT